MPPRRRQIEKPRYGLRSHARATDPVAQPVPVSGNTKDVLRRKKMPNELVKCRHTCGGINLELCCSSLPSDGPESISTHENDRKLHPNCAKDCPQFHPPPPLRILYLLTGRTSAGSLQDASTSTRYVDRCGTLKELTQLTTRYPDLKSHAFWNPSDEMIYIFEWVRHFV